MERVNTPKFQSLVSGLRGKVDLEIEQLRTEILRERKEYNSYKEVTQKNLKILLAKNTRLCSVIRQSQVEFYNVYVKLTEFFIKNNDISQKNEKLLLENSELQKKIYNLEQNMTLATATHIAEKQQLLKDKQKLIIDVKMAKSELDKLRKDKEEMRVDFSEKFTTESGTGLGPSISELLDEKRKLEISLLQKNNDLKELNRKCHNLANSLSTEISRHLTDKTELTEKIKRLEEQVQHLGAEISVEKSKNEKLRYKLLKRRKETMFKDYEERMQNVEPQRVDVMATLKNMRTDEVEDVVGNEQTAVLQSPTVKKRHKSDNKPQLDLYTKFVDCSEESNENLDLTEQRISMDLESGSCTHSTFEIITLSDSDD